MLGGDIAPDRAAPRLVAAIGRSQRDNQHLTRYLGNHQPMRRRLGWVEQRIRVPDLMDVVDAERLVFEQMGELMIDLKRIVVVERIEIEQITPLSFCNTNEYGRRESASAI